METFLVVVVIGLLVWAVVYLLKERYQLRKRYAAVVDVDEAAEKARKVLAGIEKDVQTKSYELQDTTRRVDALRREIAMLEEHSTLMDIGVYTPHFKFEDPEGYRRAQADIHDAIKEMIRIKRAIRISSTLSFGGDDKKGAKLQKQYGDLMLRAFNAECDAAISKVNWSNMQQMEARIRKAADVVNRAGEMMGISVTSEYVMLKLRALWIAHELEERRQREREEQKEIREQMREEERVKREAERAQRAAEEEEARSRHALESARAELAQAHGDAQQRLLDKIAAMEAALADATARKERAMSMAQQTRAGHVYIVSNIGSFGDGVYKIGMTRRLEPMDRIQELSNASVPFAFDVHAMVYSDDAPGVEKTLHETFNDRRLNLVNTRREFFRVQLNEIAQAAQGMGLELELTSIAQAREFRESEALRGTAV